ncbi:MAG: cytochrome C, partial [Bryobacteraceae bacterium]
MLNRDEGFLGWLSPVVHLSSNWISRIGVALVTASTVFWIFFLPASLRGSYQHPYIGILEFVLIPSVFFAGLVLIPAGLLLQARRERRRGVYPSFFPRIDLRNPEVQKLGIFIGVT